MRKYIFLIVIVIMASMCVYADITKTDATLNGLQIEEKNENGHKSIAIDESGISTSSTGFLPFTTLVKWNFDKNNKTDPPDFLKKANGMDVKMVGFMYPLEQGENIKNFCLLRSTQTCCYGPKPQYNQYVFVEMKSAVKFERLKPVLVSGKFFVDVKTDDGYIYRLEGTDIETLGNEQFKDDGKVQQLASSDAEEFKIDEIQKYFNNLEKKYANTKVEKLTESDFEYFAKIDGKPVKVKGYMGGIIKRNPGKVIIGKFYWDGCCMGVPPSLKNSVVVELKEGQRFPKPWDSEVSYSGIFKINRDVKTWETNGVAVIENSIRIKNIN